MALSDLKSNLGPAINSLKQSVTNTAEAANTDRKYLGEWLTTPQGVSWIIKQQGLQLANPKTEGGVVRGTRVFNPLEVPANALTAFIGTRFERHGFFGAQPNYEQVVNSKATLGIWNAPLVGQRIPQLNHELGHYGYVSGQRLAAGFVGDKQVGLPKALQVAGWISQKARFVSSFIGKLTGRIPILTISGVGGPNSAFGAGFTTQYRSKSGIDVTDKLAKIEAENLVDLNKNSFVGGKFGILKYTITPGLKYNIGSGVGDGIYELFTSITNTIFSTAYSSQPGTTIRNTNGGFEEAPGVVNMFQVGEKLNTKKYKDLKNPDDKGKSNVKAKLDKKANEFNTSKNEPGSISTKAPNGDLLSIQSNDSDQSQYQDDEGLIVSNVLKTDEANLYNALTYKQISNERTRIQGTSRNDDGQNVLKNRESVITKRASSGKGLGTSETVPKQYPGGAKGETSVHGEWKPFTEREGWGPGGVLDTGNGDILNRDTSFVERDDFVKLRFYKSVGSNDWNSIQFRGYVKGLTDKFNPEWDSVKYMGRPDPGYVYKGVTRDVSFNFIVAAHNKTETKAIWKKCNDLAQLVSPDVSDYGTMAGPVVGLQLGNYFEKPNGQSTELVLGGIPGHISALTFAIDDEFPWDIESNYEVPMYVRIDISFIAYGSQIPSNETTYFWNKV